MKAYVADLSYASKNNEKVNIFSSTFKAVYLIRLRILRENWKLREYIKCQDCTKQENYTAVSNSMGMQEGFPLQLQIANL